MRLLLLLTSLALGVAGCTDRPHAPSGERASATAELLLDKPGCAELSHKLNAAAVSDQAIADAYRAAKESGCLRPNI